MTQEWDDILLEPMAQLQPDLTAAEGGWRAVRSIDEVSPRPQQPPRTLPDPDGMLSIRLPVQREESSSASAPPPPSLTEQLSLTWASRRRRRRTVDQEPGENWPAWEPVPQDDEADALLPSSPLLAWLKPLHSLVRFLRQGREDAHKDPELVEKPSTEKEAPAPVTSSMVIREVPVEPSPAQPAPKLILEGSAVAPLTLAPRPASLATRELVEDSVSADEPEPAPPEPSFSEPEAPNRPATRRPDNVLRRWLARRQPGDAASESPVPIVESDSAPAPSLPPVTLVNRRERAGEQLHDDQPEEPAAETHSIPPPSDRDDGQPLPPVLRERMEKLLDVPLKEVRVFRNGEARQVTKTRRADALTAGTEVHLAPGRGNPSTPSGQALIAHELSHVAARIADRSEPVRQEERRAQAIEHAIKSQPDLAVSRQPARLAPPLEHRASVRNVAAPTATASQPALYSGGGFVGGPSGGTLSASTAVHTAPAGRIPAIADSALSAGSTGPGMRSDSSGGPPDDGNQPGQDEPGGVDRIVEAVMRRLRREGTFERERRGSFRSEIGG